MSGHARQDQGLCQRQDRPRHRRIAAPSDQRDFALSGHNSRIIGSLRTLVSLQSLNREVAKLSQRRRITFLFETTISRLPNRGNTTIYRIHFSPILERKALDTDHSKSSTLNLIMSIRTHSENNTQSDVTVARSNRLGKLPTSGSYTLNTPVADSVTDQP